MEIRSLFEGLKSSTKMALVAALLASCVSAERQEISYDEIYRNPDDYIGREVTLRMWLQENSRSIQTISRSCTTGYIKTIPLTVPAQATRMQIEFQLSEFEPDSQSTSVNRTMPAYIFVGGECDENFNVQSINEYNAGGVWRPGFYETSGRLQAFDNDPAKGVYLVPAHLKMIYTAP